MENHHQKSIEIFSKAHQIFVKIRDPEAFDRAIVGIIEDPRIVHLYGSLQWPRFLENRALQYGQCKGFLFYGFKILYQASIDKVDGVEYGPLTGELERFSREKTKFEAINDLENAQQYFIQYARENDNLSVRYLFAVSAFNLGDIAGAYHYFSEAQKHPQLREWCLFFRAACLAYNGYHSHSKPLLQAFLQYSYGCKLFSFLQRESYAILGLMEYISGDRMKAQLYFSFANSIEIPSCDPLALHRMDQTVDSVTLLNFSIYDGMHSPYSWLFLKLASLLGEDPLNLKRATELALQTWKDTWKDTEGTELSYFLHGYRTEKETKLREMAEGRIGQPIFVNSFAQFKKSVGYCTFCGKNLDEFKQKGGCCACCFDPFCSSACATQRHTVQLWNVDIHKYFPKDFREHLYSLLLCFNHWGKKIKPSLLLHMLGFLHSTKREYLGHKYQSRVIWKFKSEYGTLPMLKTFPSGPMFIAFDDFAKWSPCCAVCRVESNLRACGRCKSCWYCSRECQRKDWKRHRQICGLQSNHA